MSSISIEQFAIRFFEYLCQLDSIMSNPELECATAYKELLSPTRVSSNLKRIKDAISARDVSEFNHVSKAFLEQSELSIDDYDQGCFEWQCIRAIKAALEIAEQRNKGEPNPRIRDTLFKKCTKLFSSHLELPRSSESRPTSNQAENVVDVRNTCTDQNRLSHSNMATSDKPTSKGLGTLTISDTCAKSESTWSIGQATRPHIHSNKYRKYLLEKAWFDVSGTLNLFAAIEDQKSQCQGQAFF